MAKPLPVRATLLLLVALAFADGVLAAAPAQYEHDAAGRRVALKLPNGVKTTYAHDAAGRLTKVESKNAAGNVISAFGYALDATGNRTAMDVTLNGTVNHIAYEFDHAYRLTRETRKDAACQTLYDEGLTYDPVGNRLTRNRTQIAVVNGAPQTVTENTVYAYNNANQLLTETTNGVTTAYGYDKNGNNVSIATPAANGNPAKNIAMAYDWLNRQTKWTDGERTESTVFAGADWKRASTTVTMGANAAAAPPSIVKYLYDGDNVLADYDANNALTAFYVTPGLDHNLSITDAAGQTAYYTQDGLGSVRLLTAANGAILNRYDYTAFGAPFAPNTLATTPNRYTYTAREQSPLAAHGAPMYYRWRNYAPSAGRFMWRDPIGYEGGANVYGYVEGEPISRNDVFGLMAFVLDWAHYNQDVLLGRDGDLFRAIDGKRHRAPANSNLTIGGFVNDEWSAKFLEAADKIERNWSDQQFDSAKSNGKIRFDGKPWKGTREEYVIAIRRETESKWLVQQNDNPILTLNKLLELRMKLTKPYDDLGFAAHFDADPKYVDLPSGRPVSKNFWIEGVISNFGLGMQGNFYVAVCWRNGSNRTESIGLKGRPKVYVGKCSAWVIPVHLRKLVDGGLVGSPEPNSFHIGGNGNNH